MIAFRRSRRHFQDESLRQTVRNKKNLNVTRVNPKMTKSNLTTKAALAALSILLFAAGGCSSSSKHEEQVLITLDKEIITLSEFEEAFRMSDRYNSSRPQDKKNDFPLRAVFLKQMIEEKLILMEGKKLGISVGTEEIDATISEVKKNYGDDKSFEKVFINEHINIDKWREKIKKKLLIEKVIAREVSAHVEISEKDIEEFYNTNIEDFQYDQQVKARQIMLKDELSAVKARERIRSGEDFSAVARETSLSPDAKEGGDLGYFGRGVMPPEFDDVVFTLEAGTLSEAVRSPFGYHIFIVDERKEAGTLSIDETRDKIAETIRRKREETLYSDWIEGLRKKTKIEINKEVLQGGAAKQ